MEYLIDYLTFTIKYDKVVEKLNPSAISYSLDLGFIYEILGVDDLADCFVNIGAHQHYSQTYVYNHIKVYGCSNKREDMGYHVELSGQGCRFIESHYAEKNNGKEFNWFEFFKSLYFLMEGGLAVKICRIDFAIDDKNEILDVGEMKECVINDEIVSLYRGGRKDGELVCREIESVKRIKGGAVVGKTLYLGNKKSNSFCRIYDKKAEQIVKNIYDDEKVAELMKLKHWVRFEIVFKRTSAIKIINAMNRLSPEEFSKFLAQTINSYIRFINLDDKNKTRCTLKAFWFKFIGTVERAKLSTQGLVQNHLTRAKQWLCHSLAPTLSVMVKKLGKDEFHNLIDSACPEKRYKSKHNEILRANNEEYNYTYKEVWDSLVPHDLKNIAVV